MICCLTAKRLLLFCLGWSFEKWRCWLVPNMHV
uniref:Uncharacterized protein n=1 Tax=Arundo donax TaxID=35708 RepID=A0A0A9FFH5_ARUDO